MINTNKKRVLILGIGGVSMHQLALAFCDLGYQVVGYDKNINEFCALCQRRNIFITNRHNKRLLDVDFCVSTSAIKTDNWYRVKLTKNHIPIYDRAEALAVLTKKFGCVIAVAGSHGKTTTATLIYNILKNAGKKVSCHIGAKLDNARFCVGDDFLVVEACEYNKSFLSLNPNICVITNVEKEHLDCYKTMFALRSAFLTFVKRANKRFVYNEKSTQFIKSKLTAEFVSGCDLQLSPKLTGEYNQKNIAMACAVAQFVGVKDDIIIDTINNFNGVHRRNEYLGSKNNTKVFIDYAHHPTEISAFCSTFLHEHKSAMIVFQPHTYSRTKLLLKDFYSLFSKMQNVIIYKEYPAREKHNAGISAYELYCQIRKINPNIKYSSTLKKIVNTLDNFDYVAFVGAGNINEIAQNYLKTY